MDLVPMPKKMKLIAHRGNIYGPDVLNENAPLYIDAAISAGYDVEVDLWKVDNHYFLGHDKPQYKVEYRWIADRNFRLWIHCKNAEAFNFCQYTSFHYFWHENDQYTLTSQAHIWAYPTAIPLYDCIIAVPELHHGQQGTMELLRAGKIAGICSDHVSFYKNLLPDVRFS